MTISLKQTGVYVTVAQSWNELTGSQAAHCAEILRREIPKPEQQLLLFVILLNLKWYHFRQYINLWRIGAEARYTLATESTEFLYGDNTLTKNPFPKLQTLLGPDEMLQNITAIEFHYADKAWLQYRETGELRHLYELTAILWRPKRPQSQINNPKWDGDYRTPFNRHTYHSRIPSSPRLSCLPYAILQFYEASRALIIEGHPDIFTAGNQQQATNSSGWLDVFYSLAPNDDATKVDEIANLRLLRLLGFLVHLKKKYKAPEKAG